MPLPTWLRNHLAGEQGLEPRVAVLETAGLPLTDSPVEFTVGSMNCSLAISVTAFNKALTFY